MKKTLYSICLTLLLSNQYLYADVFGEQIASRTCMDILYNDQTISFSFFDGKISDKGIADLGAYMEEGHLPIYTWSKLKNNNTIDNRGICQKIDLVMDNDGEYIRTVASAEVYFIAQAAIPTEGYPYLFKVIEIRD